MKTFLKTLICIYVFLVFTSCSNDEEQKDQVSFVVEENTISTARTSQINSYLTNFYGTSTYALGTSITTSDDVGSYTLTEVKVGGASRARGYIVTDSATDNLLYFADIDRTAHVMRAYDIVTNENVYIENLNTNSSYNSTGFDFINIIRNSNINLANRFWGWQCGPEYSIEQGSCYRNCQYYVVWQAVDVSLTQYPSPVFSCSNLPGRNPKLINN